MGSGWNFGNVWEAAADRFPDATALTSGSLRRSWKEFERRSDSVADGLHEITDTPQAKVALLLRNVPEYMELLFAAFKSSVVAVNTNYRYGVNELVQLWNDADVEVVVFDSEFAATCEAARPHLPQVKQWIVVGEDPETAPWAIAYETLAGSGHRLSARTASGDDIFLVYTGGTTGTPKGVMWRHDDLFRMLETSNGRAVPDTVDAVRYVDSIDRLGPAVLPAAPLMHGTATFFAMPVLNRAGSVVLIRQPHFNASEMFDVIVESSVRGVCIVGDPFAVPMLEQLDARPDRWDLSGLRVVFSSGAMFSEERKQALLRHAPNAVIVDSLGSSESGSLARSVVGASESAATAHFHLGPNTRVLDDKGRDVPRDGSTSGRLAVGGFIPLGYYKDEAKTASTFLTIEDKRYVVAGDWATVEPDGAIKLLGRGSGCINTGGEKVYPEEVEEVLKMAPAVVDAAVVGMPHPRFGQTVVAAVEMAPGRTADERALIDHVKQHLAGYKAPSKLVQLDSLDRANNGKLDYVTIRDRVGAIV